MSKKASREEVDSLTGSLQWTSQLSPFLRPFLASLYNMMASGTALVKVPSSVLDDLEPWEHFLRRQDFVKPMVTPIGSPPAVIFTDACAKGGFDTVGSNWQSPWGIGGFLLNNQREVINWFACEVTVDDFPWLRHIDEPHKVIAFMELLATTIATDLWCRTNTIDEALVEFAFPSLPTDNLGNVFILQKFYTNKPPIVFLLHAFAILCLKRKIKPIVSHLKGDAGNFTELADKLSRNLTTLDPETRTHVVLHKISWLNSVRERPEVKNCVFRKKTQLKNTAKGGGVRVTIKKRLPRRQRALRKEKRRVRELEIAREVKERSRKSAQSA